jgi:hypothetical protein
MGMRIATPSCGMVRNDMEIWKSLRLQGLSVPSSVRFAATFPPGKVFCLYVCAGNELKIAASCRDLFHRFAVPLPLKGKVFYLVEIIKFLRL